MKGNESNEGNEKRNEMRLCGVEANSKLYWDPRLDQLSHVISFVSDVGHHRHEDSVSLQSHNRSPLKNTRYCK